MKISNETKVGVLTVLALAILILGFNFLKGKDLFRKSKRIYAIFNDLGSLAKSNEVKINGYVIGNVIEIDVKDKDMSGIVATINLTEDVHIPKDSKALISAPLVGPSFIVIEKGTTDSLMQNGDTLTTRVDVGILDDVKAQLTPTLTKVRGSLDTLNILLNNLNSVLSPEARAHLHQSLNNINQASASLNTLLDPVSGSLAKTLDNTKDISESLKADMTDLKATFSNAKKASEKLAALEIQPSIDDFQAAVNRVKALLTKLESSDGTLGALVNDKTLYNNLKNASLGLEILLDDMRTHPKRYVNFSIFGKKDKGGSLTSPLPKDSLPK